MQEVDGTLLRERRGTTVQPRYFWRAVHRLVQVLTKGTSRLLFNMWIDPLLRSLGSREARMGRHCHGGSRYEHQVTSCAAYFAEEKGGYYTIPEGEPQRRA